MEHELQPNVQLQELTGSKKYNAYRAAWKKNLYNTDPVFRQRRLDLDKASRDRKAALAPPKEPRPPRMSKTERYQTDPEFREHLRLKERERYHRLKAEAEARAEAEAQDLALAESLVEAWKCSPLGSLAKRATECPEEALAMALALVQVGKPSQKMT